MIDLLTNGFLSSPIATNINLNYCSHGCSYCFANINYPKRKANLTEILRLLKGIERNKCKDLVSYYLANKYPLMVSNNIDPFSKSNYSLFNQIGTFLLELGVPMFIATRGGEGWQEWSEKLPKSIWYISVPYHDDAIRQRLEPNAPSLEYRFNMVKELIKKHKIIIGINPMNENYVKDPLLIIKQYEAIGVKNFVINPIHLSPKQQTNLTETQKDVIGRDILANCKNNKFTKEYLEIFIRCYKYIKLKGLILNFNETGEANNSMDIYNECYPTRLPTHQDFFNYLAKDSTPRQVTFKEYYDFFAPKLPDIVSNTSQFIFNKANIKDKSSYIATKITNVLHYYWEVLPEPIPSYTSTLSWIKKDFGTKVDFLRDKENNKIMWYDNTKENWNDYIFK